MNQLVPKGAKIEVLAEVRVVRRSGLGIPGRLSALFGRTHQQSLQVEGRRGSKRLFESVRIHGEKPEGGESGSNGLLLDARGNLILCQHGDRRVARMLTPTSKPSSRFETLAGAFRGNRFNSPNDLVYNRKGELYFTDPPYGLVKKEKDPKREIDFQEFISFVRMEKSIWSSRNWSAPTASFFLRMRRPCVANSMVRVLYGCLSISSQMVWSNRGESFSIARPTVENIRIVRVETTE